LIVVKALKEKGWVLNYCNSLLFIANIFVHRKCMKKFNTSIILQQKYLDEYLECLRKYSRYSRCRLSLVQMK